MSCHWWKARGLPITHGCLTTSNGNPQTALDYSDRYKPVMFWLHIYHIFPGDLLQGFGLQNSWKLSVGSSRSANLRSKWSGSRSKNDKKRYISAFSCLKSTGVNRKGSRQSPSLIQLQKNMHWYVPNQYWHSLAKSPADEWTAMCRNTHSLYSGMKLRMCGGICQHTFICWQWLVGL